MIRPRVTVLEMMALVLFSAIILGAVGIFNDGRVREDESAYGIYLIVLVGATLGARSRRICAPFFRGVAIYGWVYLVVALHFGLGVSAHSTSAQYLTRRCIVAAPMGALCGILAWYFQGPTPLRKGVDSPGGSA